jgi:hypothetical protein
MRETHNSHQEKFTVSCTNIEEVKRQNDNSGHTYNEVKELIAKTGGHGTGIYSDTNVNEVKRKNQSLIE